MRTFTLLTAIVLVALQAKAKPLSPSDEEIPDQEQTDVGDKVMANSCAEDETSALQNRGCPQNLKPYCNCKWRCDVGEEINGICNEILIVTYVCCRRP